MDKLWLRTPAQCKAFDMDLKNQLHPFHVNTKRRALEMPLHVRKIFSFCARPTNCFQQPTSYSSVSAPAFSQQIQNYQATASAESLASKERSFATVNGPSAWYGCSLASANEHILCDEEIAEIDSALETLKQKGLHDIGRLTPEDSSFPRLEQKLRKIQEEVVAGKGFYLIRGLPVWRFSKWESAAAFWMIGAHFGWAVPQNGKGEMISHVRDVGADPKNPTTRIYMTNAAQPYHTDSCDIVGLLCLHPAKSGGLSSFTSSVSIHNEMLKERPDLVRILAEPFTVDRKGEVPEGKLPYYKMPVFHYHGGHLTVIYARGFVEAAQRFPEVPRLSPLQIEALDKMDELAARDGLRLDMELKPGDMQFLHNHQIVHARGEYEDHQEEHRKRHLLRLWLSPPNGRELPPIFAERYGSVTIGKNRGGIRVAGNTPYVPIDVANRKAG